jgi:hypothetical protein
MQNDFLKNMLIGHFASLHHIFARDKTVRGIKAGIFLDWLWELQETFPGFC